MLKKMTVKILILLFIIYTIGCSQDKNKENSTSSNVIPVVVFNVKRNDITKMLKLTGNIQPIQMVNVVPDISGKIKKIYVEEGDFVKKGQILAELDTRSIKLRLQQAEAGLAVAQSNFDDASKNWERIKSLFKKGTVSPQQYEKARLGYEAAEAQLKQAKAAFNLAKYQLEVSKMKAPFDGIITGKYINEQEVVNPMMPGGRGVVTVMDLSKVKITASISEKDFTDIKVGLDAKIRVDSYPDKEFFGKISKVNPTADPLSRTFMIEIQVPNEDMMLRAGMFARINIIVKKHKNVITIPVDCTIKSMNNVHVFVINNNIAEKRVIKTGLEVNGIVEVLDGLKENEQVVITGKEMLKDGTVVKVEGGDEK